MCNIFRGIQFIFIEELDGLYGRPMEVVSMENDGYQTSQNMENICFPLKETVYQNPCCYIIVYECH